MKYYSFNSISKIHEGEFEARLNPLETKKKKKNIHLLPADATWEKPKGTLKEKEVFVFEKGKWIIKKNYSGQKYYTIDNNKLFIEEKAIQDFEDIKDKILEGPDNDLIKPKWNGKKWIEGVTQKELDKKEKEKLIQNKIQSIQREQAIQILKDEGKLNAKGDLIKT